jgi:hypothetical protein
MKRHLPCAALFLVAAVLCVSFASSNQKFIGSVRIYGSEPHTYVGIVNEKDDKMYRLSNNTKDSELRALQGKRIEFTVKALSDGKGSYPPADGVITLLSYKVL